MSSILLLFVKNSIIRKLEKDFLPRISLSFCGVESNFNDSIIYFRCVNLPFVSFENLVAYSEQ